VIFGHLTVTAAGHHALKRFWPALPVALPALLLGAYLPDLVDKPVAFATGLHGRGYAHSVLVQAAVFVPALALIRRYRSIVATLALGSVIHLLEDWPKPEVLLAPFWGPIPYEPSAAFWARVLRFYSGGGIQVWLEAAAVAYWLVIGLRTAVIARSPQELASERGSSQ
jgi:hypothetical protein